MVDFEGAKNELKTWLDRLPKSLTYHNKNHSLDVYNAVTTIAKVRGIGEISVNILQIAALGHDLGYLQQYKNNEPLGADTTVNFLPKYGFKKMHIDLVKKLIHSTQVKFEKGVLMQSADPNSSSYELEQIICDADLVSLSYHPEYSMGRPVFLEQSLQLKKELESHSSEPKTILEWYKSQLNFLQNHSYYTKEAWQLFEQGKLANKILLQELIDIEEKKTRIVA